MKFTPKQAKLIGKTTREMYGLYRSILNQADPSANVCNWGKVCSGNKAVWSEIAIWHLRRVSRL